MSTQDKKTYISRSITETDEIASALLKEIIPSPFATVFLLRGDLGAGKTTFTKGMAKALGIRESVISPTFIIEKRYSIKNHTFLKTLIHIDAYRFEDQTEAGVLRLEESLSNPQNLMVIEWPDRLGQSAPEGAAAVTFESLDETTRKISW